MCAISRPDQQSLLESAGVCRSLSESVGVRRSLRSLQESAGLCGAVLSTEGKTTGNHT